MKNIVLLLAYDGTHFLGWQETQMGPSIEVSLKKVLEQILQEKITLQAASRTDAGVHAEGQVVNLITQKRDLDLNCLLKGCNALLPSSIRVCAIKEAAFSFHPTLDVVQKSYRYQICNSPVQMPEHRLYSWHIYQPLNQDAMQKGAQLLIGEHDFSSFCNSRKNLTYKDRVRTIEKIEIQESKGRVLFGISGNHFLYKMARNIVGNLVAVGLGKISPSSLLEILTAKSRDQGEVTAPAHGLSLKCVNYLYLQF